MPKSPVIVEVTVTEKSFQMLPIGRVFPSPLNVRRRVDERKLSELTDSVKTHGILTPLLVRSDGNGKFEIAAGERRYRAAKAAGLETVPAIVREMDDAQFLEVVTIENLQREDVHELDEGLGYARLMREAHYTVEQVAGKVGKSISYVYQRLKLADLIPDAQKLFLEDKITASHAILIARLQPKGQERVLGSALFKREWVGHGGNSNALRSANQSGEVTRSLSVRELELWIQSNLLLNLAKAPWKKDDAELFPEAGPCTTCPKRAANQPQLFSDVGKGDVCTDGHCFGRKLSLYIEQRRKELEAKTGKPALKLSRDYGRAGKDVIRIGEYSGNKPVAKGSCKSASPGIIVNGPGVGQVAHVCVDKGCKVHHPQEARHNTPAQLEADKRRNEKRRFEEIVNTRLAHAVLDQFDGNLTPRVLQLMLLELVSVIEDYDMLEVASQRFGIKLYAHGSNSKATLKRILEMQSPELGKFLLCLAIGRRLTVQHYFESQENENLRQLAGLVGVDPKKVLAEEKARAKEREKLGLKAGTCRICKCTVAKPCISRKGGEGPCSWTDASETLCNAPKCVKADAQVQTPAKAAKRAGKKGKK